MFRVRNIETPSWAICLRLCTEQLVFLFAQTLFFENCSRTHRRALLIFRTRNWRQASLANIILRSSISRNSLFTNAALSGPKIFPGYTVYNVQRCTALLTRIGCHFGLAKGTAEFHVDSRTAQDAVDGILIEKNIHFCQYGQQCCGETNSNADE